MTDGHKRHRHGRGDDRRHDLCRGDRDDCDRVRRRSSPGLPEVRGPSGFRRKTIFRPERDRAVHAVGRFSGLLSGRRSKRADAPHEPIADEGSRWKRRDATRMTST